MTYYYAFETVPTEEPEQYLFVFDDAWSRDNYVEQYGLNSERMYFTFDHEHLIPAATPPDQEQYDFVLTIRITDTMDGYTTDQAEQALKRSWAERLTGLGLFGWEILSIEPE